MSKIHRVKTGPLLLHGTLNVNIFEVDWSQDDCGLTFCCKGDGIQNWGRRFLGKVKRTVCCRPEVVGSRLFVTVDMDTATVETTRVIENEPNNPKWHQSFRTHCAHMISYVVFTIQNESPVGATLMGRAFIPVGEIVKGFIVDRWVDILNEDTMPRGAKIRVKLQFSSVTQDKNWSRGIITSRFDGVPYVFFNQRQNCKVTLYQDAHVPDNFMPRISLGGGKFYEVNRCWEDIFDAITNAKHLIYVAGWSVYPKIALVRDPGRPKPQGETELGELLKMKAEEGVTVLMLVWDDKTSSQELKHGLMGTNDEKTYQYFKGSKVHCVLCPRNPGQRGSKVQGLEFSTIFTHHQKTVIVDSEVLGSAQHKRRIVSFIGGIDLCEGRYDAQDHPLFKTLGTVHRNDFHQPNFSGSSIRKGGPREPWHDIHCKLDGPVAWDVLYNFEQRWGKQVGDEFLIPQNKLDAIIIRPTTPLLQPEDPEAWNVQLFRSIDKGAAFGFPERPDDAAGLGLVSVKDNIIDRSIQDAYINAIRRAKNFIYIENQYFLGSSFGWESTDIRAVDIGAFHLIPKELSLKIVSKIEAEERFTVYVVIPMWPEGEPESEPVQAMLDWQRRTMEMMYTDILAALRKKGLNRDPREYLTFFCLGNRETKKIGEYAPPETPEPDSDYSRAQHARRFMIYVHAKMMIVDDEYIIIGSANINQRSMDGARDTEIAMGAFQPHHLATQKPARGQIFGFRMALWYEHICVREPLFMHPENVECVQLVNQIADTNWEIYASDTLEGDLLAHLLRYPIEITAGGTITTIEGTDYFPDTKAHILGTRPVYLKSKVLPILTT